MAGNEMLADVEAAAKAAAKAAAIAAAKKAARVKPRNLRWSAAEKAGFLDALALTGNVHRAAAAVGRTHLGAHGIRLRDPAFAVGWRAALEAATDLLQAAVIAHALGGPVAPPGPVGMDEAGDTSPLPAPCPACGAGGVRPFDPDLALRILAQRAARGGPARAVPPSVYRQVPMAEVEKVLNRRIDAIVAAREKGGVARRKPYGSGERAPAGRRRRGEA